MNSYDDGADQAPATMADRLCHCYPATETALRREIVELAAEYHVVNRAWLMAQLRAWEFAGPSNGLAPALGDQRDKILRKLHDKCRALGMRTRK